MSERFLVLFAHARTGSENLCLALGSGADRPALAEPFNPRYPLWGQPGPYVYSEPKTVDELDEVMASIEVSYSGLKTMTYQLTPELNEALARRRNIALLFLYRRDMFAAAVSQEVAMVTRHWHTFDHRESDGAQDVVTIDPIAVVGHLRRFKQARSWMSALAQDLGAPMVSYEEIYEGDSGVQTVSALCDELEVSRPTAAAWADLLSGSVIPIRDQHSVENMTEVEKACEAACR